MLTDSRLLEVSCDSIYSPFLILEFEKFIDSHVTFDDYCNDRVNVPKSLTIMILGEIRLITRSASETIMRGVGYWASLFKVTYCSLFLPSVENINFLWLEVPMNESEGVELLETSDNLKQ